MYEERQIGWRWFRRFARFAVKGGVALGLVAGVTVYAARIPDQYACLLLINGFSRSALTFDLVDLKSGQDMLDSRSGQSPFGISSPDGRFSAMVQADKAGSSESSLIIQKNGESTLTATTIVVQKGIVDNGPGFSRFRNMRWSSDSTRLAYLWSDVTRKIYLSVVNADGTSQQTTHYSYIAQPAANAQTSPFSRGGNGGPNAQATINWSPDNTYLSVGPVINATDSALTLWSAADLKQVEPDSQVSLQSGTWSSKRHQFAAIGEQQDGSQHLIVWSPDKTAKLPVSTIPGKVVDTVIWSPDGENLALQSHRPCTALENCAGRWSFDIVGSDGTLRAGDVDGAAWANSTSTLSTIGTPSVATWSIDGKTWVFLRETSTETTKDLIAFHVANKQFETIATDIVSDLASDMLYVAQPFRRFQPGRSPLASEVTAAQRIILPTLHDGKITIELADIDGKNRTTLVQGADEILDAQLTYFNNSSRFWAISGDMVVIAWTTGNPGKDQRAHLIWAMPDGSARQEIQDDALQTISHIQVIDGGSQKWLGYSATRADDISVELAEVGTGKHYRLLDNLQNADQWQLIPAPAGNLAALQMGASSGRFYGESTLYLVALDGTSVNQLSAGVTGPAQWSPDGSQLAFVRRDSTQSIPYAEVVTPQNNARRTVPIYQAGTSQPRLYRWTKCV